MQGDMTKGSISNHLLRFSIPMILGNMIQLSYNTLAAVGTSNPIMTIFILGISGICIGASILMSDFFGAKYYRKLRREVAITLLFGALFSFFVLVIGVSLASP